MKTLKHWLDTYIAYAVLIGVIVWVVKGEALKFDHERQKYETIIHAENAEEIIEEIRETFKAGKENSEAAISSRAERDTILKKALDIANRNAVTVHQMKKKIDSINEYWIEYKTQE